MKKFILTLFLFTLPILCFLIPPWYVLFSTGEGFYDITTALQHTKKKHLIGYSYDESNYKYIKWWTLSHHERYSVVSLGSSRALQFRENMFKVSFYNAGLAAMTLTDFQPFLTSIPPKHYPTYLIINLDQWMFNAAWDDLAVIPAKEKWSVGASYFPKPEVYKNVWKDLLDQKYNIKKLIVDDSIQRIGINACLYNSGLRNDGSMSYGTQINKLLEADSSANDYQYQKTFQWIAQGIKRFEHADTLNPKALKVLEDFLSFCNNNSIQVIAYLPPYAEKVYSKMKETKKYEYLDKVYPTVVPLFQKFNYELYDYSRIEQFKSGDNEAIDGFHGGEVTYLKLLINMLESGSQLNKVCDVKVLKEDLKKRINRYTVYSY